MAVYGQTSTPTNTFANNKKVQLVAANVADARVFTKASVSKMSQSEFAGKKFGKSYTLYIPGKPKVVNGVVADPSDITEVETSVYLDNDNVSAELGAWQRLGDIEKFQDEVAGPWATTLARSQEKKIVKSEIFKAMAAVVAPKTSAALDGADYGVLSQATAKLRKLALSSELIGFLDPDVEAEISSKAIASKFITSDSQFLRLRTCSSSPRTLLPTLAPSRSVIRSLTLTPTLSASPKSIPSLVPTSFRATCSRLPV